MELTFADEMFHELIEAARERHCSPRQFAVETLEAALADRRILKVPPAPYGARMTGQHGEEEEVEPESYPVHRPEGINGGNYD
jgi:hypothetical protein